MEERIKYAELFEKVCKAVKDGYKISSDEAKIAHEVISMLVDNPALTSKERDEMADLGIVIRQATDDS